MLGGSFAVITSTNALTYTVNKLCERFAQKKQLLLSLTSLFFMLLGSCVGLYEESILLAPISISLALALGYDVFTGLFISVLSTGFGFAAGVFNPFTTGVAQQLAGVEVFSGAGFRALSFLVIFIILNIFIQIYSRKVYKTKEFLNSNQSFEASELNNQKRAMKAFIGLLICMVVWVFLTTQIKSLSDYTMPVLALIFLFGGILTGFVAKQKPKAIFRTLSDGIFSILPGVMLILMASAVKYIMELGKVLDTLLYIASSAMQGMGVYSSVLAIYLFVLILNFFIGSGSAKAFLVIPLVAPIATMSGVGIQSAILAFLFGDGFSNTFYITNPVLLITLGISGVSYMDWIKKTWVLQVITLTATVLLLILSIFVSY